MSQITVPVSSLLVDSVLRDSNAEVTTDLYNQLTALADTLIWQNRAVLLAHLMEASMAPATAPRKRRGRPRKNAEAVVPENNSTTEGADTPPMLKRRRGRPRKVQPIETMPAPAETLAGEFEPEVATV